MFNNNKIFLEKLVIFCKVEWTCVISSFQRFFFKIPCFYPKNCNKATWNFRRLLISFWLLDWSTSEINTRSMYAAKKDNLKTQMWFLQGDPKKLEPLIVQSIYARKFNLFELIFNNNKLFFEKLVIFCKVEWTCVKARTLNSPIYIRQKRRDLEQIATEGFLGSSWSCECPH
jgi:hypothetical protein